MQKIKINQIIFIYLHVVEKELISQDNLFITILRNNNIKKIKIKINFQLKENKDRNNGIKLVNIYDLFANSLYY